MQNDKKEKSSKCLCGRDKNLCPCKNIKSNGK